MSSKPSARLLATAAMTAAATALGALAIAGCSAATAEPKTVPKTAPKAAPVGATVTDAAAAHKRGSVHLTAYTDNDGPTETVIVTGAIGDYGQAVSVHPDGTIDPEHDSELSLRLSKGTFRLDIASLDKAFVAVFLNHFPTDQVTCSGSFDVTQRVSIVPGSGTGAYRGVGGAFTLTIALDEVDKVSAAEPCTAGSAFLSQAIVTSGPGSITF